MKNTSLIVFCLFCSVLSRTLRAQNVIRVGIIGLDTSHSPAFVELLNSDNPKPEHQGFRVVAAYPYGSQTIENSYKRIPIYTERVKKYGVEIVSSIAELLDKVDCVLLETNDGNLHFEQAKEVLKSKKPMFIDKPVAANLVDAIAIFKLAELYNVPIFSSSALRFVPQNIALRNAKYGKVLGADCFSPAPGEPSHPDFSWYGIHGVEILYTLMGTGCQEVSRMSSEGTDVVVGLWEDGRIGTFRGTRTGKHIYGGIALCDSGAVNAGGYEGYGCLLTEILKFFKTKEIPVNPDETLEMFTFMAASNESKRLGGKPVEMKKVFEKAEKQAEKKINNSEPLK